MCAVVAVALTLGALGMAGRVQGRSFVVWGLGMLVFAAADITYAYRLAFDSYRAGSWLDVLWPAGLVLVAIGATTLQPRETTRALPGARSLAVSAVAAVSTIAVLAAAPPWSESPLPSVLALLTLATCAVRLLLAFFQLRELAAVRALALTDELTGAPATAARLYVAPRPCLRRAGGRRRAHRLLARR